MSQPQRRSRRIAGQDPSLIDEESAREVYDQLLALDYSEERAHELVQRNIDDLENFDYLSLFAQLRTKGFDDEQARDLVNNHSASYIQLIMRIYDNFLPTYANDGQSTAKFVLLYLEMSNDQLELNDAPRFAALSCAQKMLTESTLRLKEGKLKDKGEITVELGASYDDQTSVLLAQDQEILLPSWRKLATAISLSKRGSIALYITNMELSKDVQDMLLIDGPLKQLILMNNNLFENDGVDDFISVLNRDSSLEDLSILNNLVKGEEDAQSLVNAMINHPKLENIMLNSCGLGCNDSVMKSIVTLFGSLDGGITLNGNQIGSLGVKLISECLASNPMLCVLQLKDNLLNDADAATLATSLKSNTNLRILKIAGNNITQEGMKSFHLAVQNLSSLNAISDSNHTCLVIDGDKELSLLNTRNNPNHNKAEKLINVLGIQTNMRLLNNIPIELMPRVLYLVQGRGLFIPSLCRTFMFIRQWSMPLLFTSCVGLEPRRSERVRKKMIMNYMIDK